MSECGQVQLLESQLGRQSVPLRTSPAAAFHQLEFHHAHSMELLALRAQVCGFAAAAHELLTARELTLLTGWMAWVDLWLRLVLHTLCSVLCVLCFLLTARSDSHWLVLRLVTQCTVRSTRCLSQSLRAHCMLHTGPNCFRLELLQLIIVVYQCRLQFAAINLMARIAARSCARLLTAAVRNWQTRSILPCDIFSTMSAWRA